MGLETNREIEHAAQVLDRTARATLNQYYRLLAARSRLLSEPFTTQEAYESLPRHAESLALSSSNPPVNYSQLAALLRRDTSPTIIDDDPIVKAYPLSLNALTREIETPYLDPEEMVTVTLSPKESRVIHILMENQRRVVPYDIMMEWVWGEEPGSPSGLKTHLSHFGKKTGARHHVQVRPGIGYIFLPGEEKRP